MFVVFYHMLLSGMTEIGIELATRKAVHGIKEKRSLNKNKGLLVN